MVASATGSRGENHPKGRSGVPGTGDHFGPESAAAADRLCQRGRLVQIFEPELTDLQRQDPGAPLNIARPASATTT